jgi:pyruvate-formate lyase
MKNPEKYECGSLRVKISGFSTFTTKFTHRLVENPQVFVNAMRRITQM